MSLSIESNGRSVSSNKSCATCMSGGRIDFSDGSWCDLNTGEVVVFGRGFIILDGKKYDRNTNDSVNPKKAANVDRIVTHDLGVFDAISLLLTVSAADACVNIHDGPGIRLKVTARASQIGMIKHTLRKRTLHVSDASTRGGNNSNVTSRGDSGIFSRLRNFVTRGILIISGSGASVSGAFGGEPQAKIEISVPKGTPVNVISNGSGNATIGDIKAHLVALATGSGDLDVGHVTDASVQTSSSSDISIRSINGDATIQATGSGNTIVKDGVIEKLTVTVQASGSVAVETACQRARLVTSGSGDIEAGRIISGLVAESRASGNIYIGNADGDVTLLASGSGDVVIHSGAIDALSATTRSSGYMSVSVTAQTALLTTTGSGDIVVERVVQPPIRQSRASGTINVRRVG